MSPRILRTWCGAAALLLSVACGDSGHDDLRDDAGTNTPDGSVPTPDSGAPDSGTPEEDGGTNTSPDGGPSGGPNATVPGAVTLPFPTLRHLTVEWAFTGDANANGTVAVRFRPAGSSTWRKALPLRRIPAGSNEGFSWAQRHSGSIFGLQPATTYDLELTLADPDGGGAVRTATATTRAVPAPMANAPVKAVTPANFASIAASAQPGDLLELGSGTYTGFDWSRSGTEGKPIVLRGTSGTVINGPVNLFNQNHVHFDRLTINGRLRFNGTKNFALTRSTINATSANGGDAVVTFLRAENAYIADNVVTGITPWAESSLGVNGNNQGEGICVTGPGHVIQNNRVTGFRDGISFMEDDAAVDQYSIDVLDNDLIGNADDGVEADFCAHNCRIVGNRLTNNFIALSSQPSLGGPTYFVRNAVYNAVHIAFKLYRGSSGDVLLHNTVVKHGDAFGITATTPVARLLARNNLFIGGPGGTFNGYSSGSAQGSVLHLPSLTTANADLDHDGFGSTSGTFNVNWGGTRITSLNDLRANTTEKHAVQVDLGVFAATVAYPASPMTLYAAPDLRPRAGSTVENAGTPLDNITDGYAGSAPDLGALEVGAPIPTYGPRP
ncbi:right-handed parallel beta-helix repeat-containing protein [Myxococcus faecalis]|uniref:right-handed parallel beta-helix repeat-containing protein n=1 Tax=Myxococcus faecalis TaxID=3115646 RepID=UPI003CED417A